MTDLHIRKHEEAVMRSPTRDRNELLCRKPSAVYANRMQRYPDNVWLIWSNKWGCWYRPNCSGYTTDIAQAGLYDRETAAQHYLGNIPRRYRDVEPFPLSSVQHQLRLAVEAARAAHEKAQQRLDLTTDALTDPRALGRGTAS